VCHNPALPVLYLLESDEGEEGDAEQERAVDVDDDDADKKVHCQNYPTKCVY